MVWTLLCAVVNLC